MKVLEKGSGWNLKQKCTGEGNGGGGCESLLLIEEDDVYVTASTDISGYTDYYYTFCCPVCGTETDIPNEDVPSRIQRKRLDEYKKGIQTRAKVYERSR